MLISIIEESRSGVQSQRLRKILKLRCDECKIEFHRRWQREVSEQLMHCCSRKCACALRSKDPEWRVKISETTKRRMNDSDVRQRFDAGMIRRSENPMFRVNLSKACKERFVRNPQLKTQHAERVRKKFSDPVYRAAFKQKQNDPNLRALRSQRAKHFWSQHANRIAMAEKIKKSWASGKTGHGSSTWIVKQSIVQRKVWDDASYRESRSGSNNAMSGQVNAWWKSWMTNHRSDLMWIRKIRTLCGKRCLICGQTEKLEAHHVAPKSTHPELKHDLNNGVALCSNCHDGATNPNNVHRLLRKDPEAYEKLMKELMLKRDMLFSVDT